MDGFFEAKTKKWKPHSQSGQGHLMRRNPMKPHSASLALSLYPLPHPAPHDIVKVQTDDRDGRKFYRCFMYGFIVQTNEWTDDRLLPGTTGLVVVFGRD